KGLANGVFERSANFVVLFVAHFVLRMGLTVLKRLAAYVIALFRSLASAQDAQATATGTSRVSCTPRA
ncbi:MAG: hypothetical protein ACKVK6_11820, partial [bacterium]